MKSSTVVLPNSGHDHLRIFCVFFEKKSRFPYAVAASASVIHVLLASQGCISGGLRGFLPKNTPLLLQMFQQRRDRDQGWNRMASVADRDARGLNSICYTTRMYPQCFPLKNQRLPSEMQSSARFWQRFGCLFGHRTHHCEKSKKSE